MGFEIKCMYPRRVDSEMVKILPVVRYKGEIVLVETEELLDKVLPEISKEKVLGFDTETRPNFNKGRHYPVSILQLGGTNKVWIIRLDPLANRLADIYQVLENPSIKKVGIAVQGDIKSLRERSVFNPAGFVDVSQSTSHLGVINTGMRNLTAVIFGERILKTSQLTNWASNRLTPKQIEYAATDAWISRRLFLEIRQVIGQKRTIIEPEPEPEPEKFNLRTFVHRTILKVFGSIGKDSSANRNRRNAGKSAQNKKPTGNIESDKSADDNSKKSKKPFFTFVKKTQKVVVVNDTPESSPKARRRRRRPKKDFDKSVDAATDSTSQTHSANSADK